MSYSIHRKDECRFGEIPGHFRMVSCALHQPQEVNDGKLTVCMSEFLPGGGSEMEPCAAEIVFVMLRGTLDFQTADQKFRLQVGDSFHADAGTEMAFINNGSETARAVVVLRAAES